MSKIFWEQHALELTSNQYKVGNLIHSLSLIEKEFIDNIKDKDVLHIFCNFGMNTFSMEDMGASVTGLDYNSHSIDFAKTYKNKINSKVSFICEDFFKFNTNKKFDIIYGSYGVLDWVSDLNFFIEKIYNLLNRNGRFIFVEFHSDFFSKYFEQMSGIKYEDIQYEIKTKYQNRIGKSGTSALGNGYSYIEDVYIRPYVHDTYEFIHKLKLRGFEENKLKFYDYLNFKMRNSIEISKHKFRNKYLNKNEKMCFGLDFMKK